MSPEKCKCLGKARTRTRSPVPVVLAYCHSLHILGYLLSSRTAPLSPWDVLCYCPIVTHSRLPGGAQGRLADHTMVQSDPQGSESAQGETVGENYCLWPPAMSKGLCLLGPCFHCGKAGVSSIWSTGTPPGSGECVLSRLPKSQRETFDHSALHHLVHSPEWAAVEMRASAYSYAPSPRFNQVVECCAALHELVAETVSCSPF